MKKIRIIIFLIIVCCLNFVLTQKATAAELEPINLSIKVDNKNAKSGDTIKFIAKSDVGLIKGKDQYCDREESIESLDLLYNLDGDCDDKSDNLKSIELNYNHGKKYYEGSYTVSKYDQCGKWKFLMFKEETIPGWGDRYPLKYNNDIDLNIYGTLNDKKPPVLDLNSLKINKTTVKPGEEIKLSFKAEDDVSGIEKVNVNYGQSDYNKNVKISYDEKNNIYKGTFIIDKYDFSGRLDCSIELFDKCGRVSYYYPDKFSINTIGTKYDKYEPTFDPESIKFSKDTVIKGDEINLEVHVDDDVSGVKSAKVRIYKYRPNAYEADYEEVNLKGEANNKIFKCNFKIPVDSKYEEYIIDSIELIDNSGKKGGAYSDFFQNYGKNFSFYIIDKIKEEKWVNDSGKWSYINSDGTKAKDWKKINQLWYYFDGNYEMQTDWKVINGKWYKFDNSGAMKDNWYKEGNTWYYLEGGAMQTGWKVINGKWYNFDNSGAMKDNWYKEGNAWYYLEGGAMQTGWKVINGKWYKFDNSGVMKDNWYKEGNTWYYLEGGALQTGWKAINGKWYKFDNSGAMKDNWYKEGNAWYYLEGGAMQTGWKKINNNWYYFNNSGVMVTDSEINGWKIDNSGIAKKK